MMTNRLALLVALSLAGAACARRSPQKSAARPVRLDRVQAAGHDLELRYSATIQPHEQVALAFKVGGYVRDVLQRPGPDGVSRSVQQGDLVTRGAVLARVAPADYEERVRQARAQLADADARLSKTRSDAARAETLYRTKALTRPDY